MEEDHARETCQRDEDAGREEFAFGELHQQNTSEECAYRACEEIDAVAHAGVRERQVATLHQQFGEGDAHAHVNAYQDEDADEEGHDVFVFEQREGMPD